MSAHTFKATRPGVTGKRIAVAGAQHIDRFWAAVLRSEYRLLRDLGVPRSVARSALHTGYHVGLNAARQEAHEERMAAIRGAA